MVEYPGSVNGDRAALEIVRMLRKILLRNRAHRTGTRARSPERRLDGAEEYLLRKIEDEKMSHYPCYGGE